MFRFDGRRTSLWGIRLGSCTPGGGECVCLLLRCLCFLGNGVWAWWVCVLPQCVLGSVLRRSRAKRLVWTFKWGQGFSWLCKCYHIVSCTAALLWASVHHSTAWTWFMYKCTSLFANIKCVLDMSVCVLAIITVWTHTFYFQIFLCVLITISVRKTCK